MIMTTTVEDLWSDTPLAEFGELIELYADYYSIDPHVVAAVIMIESSGNPNAINPESGATGLGQIMPQEAGELFSDRPTQAELLDPETNIEWTCKLLHYYIVDELLSVYHTLWKYSGFGNRSREEYEPYWHKFKAERERLAHAGIGCKTAHFAGHTVGAGSLIIIQPDLGSGHRDDGAGPVCGPDDLCPVS
jgi:hypothetical protein